MFWVSLTTHVLECLSLVHSAGKWGRQGGLMWLLEAVGVGSDLLCHPRTWSHLPGWLWSAVKISSPPLPFSLYHVATQHLAETACWDDLGRCIIQNCEKFISVLHVFSTLKCYVVTPRNGSRQQMQAQGAHAEAKHGEIIGLKATNIYHFAFNIVPYSSSLCDWF